MNGHLPTLRPSSLDCVNDPRVTGDPAFLAHLDDYINSESCLKDGRGTTVERNACQSSWSNVFSLRVLQEVGGWGDRKFEVSLDIENIGNLINSNRGRLENFTAPSNVAPVVVGLTEDGSQYIYSPTSVDVVSGDTVVAKPAISRLSSAYRIQLGVRFRF